MVSALPRITSPRDWNKMRIVQRSLAANEKMRNPVYDYLERHYTARHDPLSDIQDKRDAFPPQGLTYYRLDDLCLLLAGAGVSETDRTMMVLELKAVARKKERYFGRETFVRYLESKGLVEPVATYCAKN